jgi:hypothetical protein
MDKRRKYFHGLVLIPARDRRKRRVDPEVAEFQAENERPRIKTMLLNS